VSEPVTSRWQPRSAWDGLASAGRHGSSDGNAGVRIALRADHALATVIVRDGQEAAFAAALRDILGMSPPDAPRAVQQGEHQLVWSGPGQWLFVGPGRATIESLTARLQGLAAVSDQSDARAMLRISGPRARDALAKGCMIDLHPRAFTTGDTALTSIAHIGIQLWQVGDAPSYDIIVFRSMAASFWSWLSAASAEFGCDVVSGRT
jgi:heterotetrameric sarcosine oxidase gamma subunit